MAYGVISADGKVTRYETFETPYPSMVHDFMVTRGHVLFPVLPLTGSMERALSGKPAYAWEPAKGGHVGVLRRDARLAEMRWFKVDPCYVFHPMNAWEEADFNRAVRETGRRKLIMAALWTEVCLVHPALDALHEGFEVYPVVDCVGVTSLEAHEAGGRPTSWVQRICELQRDWNRENTVPGFADILFAIEGH